MNKINSNLRYELCPQMREYDKMIQQWLPHLMFTQIPCYKSNVINTDINGFRFNNNNNLKNDSILINEKKKSLLLGNSAAFGVGATQDTKTISSLLSDNDLEVLNFGGRAYNSFQEIISYISFCDKLDKVSSVNIFSGVNDYFMFKNSIQDSFVGPLYNASVFDKKMHRLSFLYRLKKIMTLKFDFNHTYHKYPKTTLESIINRNLYFWKKICDGANIKLNFFLQPYLFWCKDPTHEETQLVNNLDKRLDNIKYEENYNELSTMYKNICDKYNIYFYDTNKFFSSVNDKWLFVDSIHLNDDGYKLIAENLKKWI